MADDPMPAPDRATTAHVTTGDVTTVVATRNRWSDLQQSLPRHEGPVILVDNASDDGTPDKVRHHFPDVEVVPLPANHGAVARNVGVQLARTPYVAFADDDSWWAPGALAMAADCFARCPRLGLVAGQVRVGVQESIDPVSAAMAEAPLGLETDLPGPSVLGFLACGAVVRRSAFLEVGGFDEVVFFRGEEERVAFDLTARGWGLAYVPTVVAHHHPSVQRSPERARRLSARNHLLTAVMRRPWPVVAATVRQTLASGSTGRSALSDALVRTPGALRHRRVVPASVERSIRLLEQHS